jgi:hypothetical protein
LTDGCRKLVNDKKKGNYRRMEEKDMPYGVFGQVVVVVDHVVWDIQPGSAFIIFRLAGVTQNVIGWEISHEWEWFPNWDESFAATRQD